MVFITSVCSSIFKSRLLIFFEIICELIEIGEVNFCSILKARHL